MKRLTEKEQDYYRLKDYQDPCKAIDQLGRYEDIGFSPEELQQLVDRQKWHVVADGDLPEEVNKTYQCTVLDKFREEIVLAEVPVSYTHLDVYKRQGIPCLKVFREPSLFL